MEPEGVAPPRKRRSLLKTLEFSGSMLNFGDGPFEDVFPIENGGIPLFC